MMFYATLQIQAEMIDDLKGTSIYNQKYKNLSNQLLKMNEEYLDRLGKVIDQGEDSEEVDIQYNNTVELVELFIKVLEKDVDQIMQFKEVIKEFLAGNTVMIDEEVLEKMKMA